MSTKEEKTLEELKEIARVGGWRTCPFCGVGHTCRGCHKEIISWGYTENAWMSPKGTFYHIDCAVKRFEKKLKISVA